MLAMEQLKESFHASVCEHFCDNFGNLDQYSIIHLKSGKDFAFETNCCRSCNRLNPTTLPEICCLT